MLTLLQFFRSKNVFFLRHIKERILNYFYDKEKREGESFPRIIGLFF